MNNNFRNSLKTGVVSARRFARDVWSNAPSAFAVGLTMVPGVSFAQADPAGAISGEISGVKASVGAILVILAGVLGLMLLWSYIRKAK
jgi:hypothetical protein